MFEFLRKMIGPIMIAVLVAFVATIIFQWGGWDSTGARDTVGKVDGEKISVRLFDQYYSGMYREEQEKTDDDLSPEKVTEIRNKAWSRLVTDYLIKKEIDKRNIVVTSEEIYGYLKLYPPQELQTAPQFTTDGEFDYQKYRNAMMAPENAPFWTQVEMMVTPELKQYKLQEELLSTVRVTPAEVLNAYLAEKETAKIGYINIPNHSLRSLVTQPDEEEERQYYEANKEQYRIGPRAVANIVLFDKTASENDWDRAYHEIKDIYDSAIAGVDFGELAQAYSDDGSASAGGDLSWFPKGRMVPEFDSVTWALEIDEISEPFRTRFGWHIVKLLGIRDAEPAKGREEQVVALEQRHAAHILIRVTPSQETLDQILLNAQDFVEEAHNEGFKEAAEHYNYEVETTQPFTRGGFMTPIRSNDEMIEFFFTHEEGEVSHVMENSSAFFVLSVESRIPEGYQSFEEVKTAVASKLMEERAFELAYDTASVIRHEIMEGVTFTKAGEKYGYPYETTDPINRNSSIPGIGTDPAVLGAAFALPEVNAISNPIRHARGYIVMTLLDRTSANLENFNQVQDSVQIAVLQQKQQQAYSRWYDVMIQSAKIENYLDRFYQTSP